MANLKLYSFYLFAYSCWILVVGFILSFFFDFLNSTYFNFGPNPNLYLIGTNFLVDTWSKYLFYSFYLFIDSFIVVFVNESILPWINASILNQEAKMISNDKVQTFVFVNAMYIIMVFRALFSIGSSLTQIDFFIYINLGRLLAGSFTSGIAIYKKEYEKIEEELFWL